MEAKCPRILVFTVAAWNSKIGSNTWSTLLGKYGADNIANICIRDEIPDNPVCNNYFSVSESAVIKSILNRKIKTGRRVAPAVFDENSEITLEAHNARYTKMKRNRRYSMLLAREIIWKLGKWKTTELDEFIDEFKPDIILHSMEGYIHLNRIIEYSVKRSGARAVGYIWDDNFTYKQSEAFGYKLYRFFQRKSLKRLAGLTSSFFAISDMTKAEADEFFGIDCRLLTKPLSSLPIVSDNPIEKPIKMLYTGKLIIGRDNTLLRVCRATKKFGNAFSVEVYTPTELEQSAKDELIECGCILNKPIPQAEALEKQKEADVLLFLEDIDGESSKMARLSFSTKITDYLSAGKCIFAVGNADTAPMQYFIKYKAGIAATNDSGIEKALSEISSADIIRQYAENAAEAGRLNHDPVKIQSVFDSTIYELI